MRGCRDRMCLQVHESVHEEVCDMVCERVCARVYGGVNERCISGVVRGSGERVHVSPLGNWLESLQ